MFCCMSIHAFGETAVDHRVPVMDLFAYFFPDGLREMNTRAYLLVTAQNII